MDEDHNTAAPEERQPATAAPAKVISKKAAPFIQTSRGAVLMPRDLRDAVKLAEFMAQAEGMVAPFLIGRPETCLGIIDLAMRWGMSPFAVAQKAYQARDGGQINYEAQLVHAAVLTSPALATRLSHEIIGTGDDRRCKVWATLKGETEPRVFTSETLKALRPASGDKGVKGSPLWIKKPELQMFYNASRDWARVHVPDVLLGVYTRDEILDGEIIETPPAMMIDPFAGEGPRALPGVSSSAPGDLGEVEPPVPAPVSSEES